LKPEAEREQFVLATNGFLPGKAETLFEPEHRLETGYRSLRRGECAETAVLWRKRHRPVPVVMTRRRQFTT